MPNIPGGLAVSVVGIVNGAINGIAPQVFVFLRSLGVVGTSRSESQARSSSRHAARPIPLPHPTVVMVAERAGGGRQGLIPRGQADAAPAPSAGQERYTVVS